jgi:sugar fermentation stimulation protein A
MPSTSEDQVFEFKPVLELGTIVSRPNRFIMIIKSSDRTLRCHCPTTGRLGDLRLEGLPCLYSTSANQKRKTAHTVEAISISGRGAPWAGINQTAANRYFEFFLRQGALSRMALGDVKREVRLGSSRIDFQVGNTFLEVKTPLITLPGGRGISRVAHGRFDSFDRLIRHMGELRKSLALGGRAVIALCFLYDADPFLPPSPNRSNSKILAAARAAEKAGVERWQVNMKVEKSGVTLIRYFRSKPYEGANAAA